MERGLLLLALFHLAASQSCPGSQVSFGGKCYYYDATTVDMISAQQACWNMNYDLVEIDSSEENNFVQSTMQNSLTGVWMGIKRRDSFVTSSTGEDLKFVNWLPWWDFTNLETNCAIIDASGGWKNANCELKDQVYTMCESQAGQTCREGELSFQGTCYSRSSNQMKMESAEEYCRNMQYNLLEINNIPEDKFLTNICKQEGTIAFWLAMKRRIVWHTISTSQEVNHTNWAPNFPFNDYSSSCVLITSEGQWKNVYCGFKDQASIMCESRLRPTNTCPENAFIFKEKCYVFGDLTSNMLTAHDACKRLGFDLVVINDVEENNYILDHMVGRGGTAGWLGLYRMESWVILPTMTPTPYTRWDFGYPTDDAQAQCVLMDSTGRWKSARCSNTSEAIMMCEKHIDCPDNGHVFKGKRYLIGPYTVNMTTSQNVCPYLGYHLVIINDAEQNDFIRYFIARQNFSGGIGGWIGLYWHEPLTLLPNMERATYTNWAAGYPSGDGECVFVDATGHWKNLDCDNTSKAVVMCQKNQVEHDCPEEFFKENLYLFGDYTVSFTQNTEACGYIGLDCLFIGDVEENNYVRDYIARNHLAGGWLNLKWDQTVAYSLELEIANYTNWAPGYPSGSAECVFIDGTGYWKNIPCENETQAVVMCEN